MICPTKFPTIASKRKIAIIGEFPSPDDERSGSPFTGYAGAFLNVLLSRANVSRESCLLGNVTPHRPGNNDLLNFQWDGPQIQTGITQLEADIASFNPNVVLLLGNLALKVAKEPYSSHPLVPRAFKHKVSSWRGSVFVPEQGPFAGRKCITSYTPGLCQRDYELTPFLQLDIRKAAGQSETPELRTTPRTVEICDTVGKVMQRLSEVRLAGKLVSVDLEGYYNCMTCIGFGVSRNFAFVIPLKHKDNSPYWSRENIVTVWRNLAGALEDPGWPKTFQYGLYDTFVLHYGHGIRVQNYRDDTIHKHWEIYSELAKADSGRATSKRGMGLAIQASIYTDMPYYKSERTIEDSVTHYNYCGTDCMVTKEIDEVTECILNGDGTHGFTAEQLELMRGHYAFNGSLLPAFRYLTMRGIRYDAKTADARCFLLKQKIYEVQARLNKLTGYCFSCKSVAEIQQAASALMLTKKGNRPLKTYAEDWPRVQELLHLPDPNLATIGELETLCEVGLNVDSPKVFNHYLYERLRLPIQYSNDKENPKPTSDYEALLKLAKYCTDHKHTALPVIHAALEIRSLATRIESLNAEVEPDGRMRFSYNITGSNTGRTQCSKSATGKGRAGQGVPNYTSVAEAPGGILGDRDLFTADDGKFFFQCDLKGADGWTVAAYAAMLGDPTMLDDYSAGLKPANILALMLRGVSLPPGRDEIRILSRKVDKDDWDYFACKRVQHGCSYLEGALTVSRNILKDSEGKLTMSVPECQQLKNLFFTRYPGILEWHKWVARRLSERPILVAASGQVRHFFGRPDEIITKAVAFEPQANTTFATNLAMRALWLDPYNRIGRKFRVEPLHQVHDAICGQFGQSDVDWSVASIKRYFDNPLTIAGRRIIIPFDGAYGISWGNTKAGKI